MALSLVEIGSALSDPSRLRLLAAVIDPPAATGEVCVCELTELVDLAPSTVSKHLSILRAAGLIEGRKDGRWMYYRAAGDGGSRPVRDAIGWVRAAKQSDAMLTKDARRLADIMRQGAACCSDGAGDSARTRKLRVLFLCTGNSCRSQMAEGWARHLKSDVVEAHSAGTHPHGLNPLAVLAMREAGVDISQHTSKKPEQIGGEFDVVVTVCDSAREACPTLPGAARMVHVGFDDPPRLAAGAKTDEEAMMHYRRVRDEIRKFVEGMPENLTNPPHPAPAPRALQETRP